MGFNPTDDGEFLATARRLLDGQVPHRDFIWPYPVLTSVVHAPEVAFGGDHMLWITRFVVWIELALLAWCWTRIFRTGVAAALVAFALSVHTFQIMTWHTIDGLLAASLGIWWRMRRPGVAPWLLIGSAALFKQSFLPAVPLLLIASGDWRRPSRVIAGFAPSALYALFVIATGGLRGALIQFGARSDVFETGVKAFLFTPLIAILGALLAWKLRPALLIPIAAAALIVLLRNDLSGLAFMALFGIAAGVVAVTRDMRGVYALIVAWCAALSYGENNPGFAAGALAIFLIASIGEVRVPVTAALALIVVPSIAAARWLHPDAERPARELRYSLDGVLPGFAGIRTNANTHAYLADLSHAIARANGPYTIFPDNAGVWAASKQPNPICIDWAQLVINERTIDGRNPLADRVIADIDRQRGHLAVIVQKVEAGPLFARIEPLSISPAWKPIYDHIRTTMTKSDETTFFEIYR